MKKFYVLMAGFVCAVGGWLAYQSSVEAVPPIAFMDLNEGSISRNATFEDQLRALAERDPEKDAVRSFSRHDARPFGIVCVRADTPGYATPQMNAKTITFVTDYIRFDSQKKLNSLAHQYAEKYNAKLLELNTRRIPPRPSL